ncbi:hypothetical protein OLX02_03425 [Novosphingobium sp. KCTC 2891]|uniref:hypothetical protein n=1 Tax=Novosphingobium sp. KCTC 2891 TaxID=2989730 RepID=UPI002221FBF7|nr:hypothetical protein [Novosphingobium sp. KCTC 2891]MCW1381867.1 hypothetical protein [Novosphingobium sp. KCTC 2891]
MRKALTAIACTAVVLGWSAAAVANPEPHPTEHPKDDHGKDGEHKDEHKPH